MIKFKRISISAFVLSIGLVYGLFAQGYNVPLTMEGLNHSSNPSIMSKAMGGVTLSLQRDISLMFANPASMTTLDGPTISVSSTKVWSNSEQTQQWTPLNAYGLFSLIMDGTLVGVKLPSVDNVPTGEFAGDTLWGAYDNIGPNWRHKRDVKLIPNIFVGVPFIIAGIKISAGLGYSEYANMDYYYQNNNHLTPTYDLISIGEGKVRGDSVRRFDWMQTIHNREGNLYGYGGAASVNIADNFSAGLSARIIGGSTNDLDGSLGRGVFWFYSADGAYKYLNFVRSACLRLDSAVYTKKVVGSSDYDGFDASMSMVYRGKNVTVGLAVTLPTTISRKFSGQVVSDTTKTKLFSASSSTTDLSFSTDMNLPVHGNIGIGIKLRENVFISAEVEYLPYHSAELINKATGDTTNPWLDGTSVHFGFAWNPVETVSLYLGYRRANEVFQTQYSAFTGAPVSYIAYSVGVGVDITPRLRLNAAYEFFERKYIDVWQDNSNINILSSNTISASISYSIGSILTMK
ncbi:MAG: hypothetical protein EHM64_03915 [Ignavibacteriae bacterium]|nr:MAG: hypothetical protein EHM64_03915 [Ignavibacteriota bacterium]